jgi:hypothetical protein
MMKPESSRDGNFLINSLVLYTCCHVLIVSNGWPKRIPHAWYFEAAYATRVGRKEKEEKESSRLLIYLMYVL